MAMMDADACVIDTNVLVYSTVSDNPWHQADLLRTLVRRHQIRGKRIHDANIVAVMLTHRVYRLATYNWVDFEPFDEIALERAPV